MQNIPTDRIKKFMSKTKESIVNTRAKEDDETTDDKEYEDRAQILNARNKVGISPVTMKKIYTQYLVLHGVKRKDDADTIFHSENSGRQGITRRENFSPWNNIT